MAKHKINRETFWKRWKSFIRTWVVDELHKWKKTWLIWTAHRNLKSCIREENCLVMGHHERKTPSLFRTVGSEQSGGYIAGTSYLGIGRVTDIFIVSQLLSGCQVAFHWPKVAVFSFCLTNLWTAGILSTNIQSLLVICNTWQYLTYTAFSLSL